MVRKVGRKYARQLTILKHLAKGEHLGGLGGASGGTQLPLRVVDEMEEEGGALLPVRLQAGVRGVVCPGWWARPAQTGNDGVAFAAGSNRSKTWRARSNADGSLHSTAPCRKATSEA